MSKAKFKRAYLDPCPSIGKTMSSDFSTFPCNLQQNAEPHDSVHFMTSRRFNSSPSRSEHVLQAWHMLPADSHGSLTQPPEKIHQFLSCIERAFSSRGYLHLMLPSPVLNVLLYASSINFNAPHVTFTVFRETSEAFTSDVGIRHASIKPPVRLGYHLLLFSTRSTDATRMRGTPLLLIQLYKPMQVLDTAPIQQRNR
jgi:hypothetical protein